MQLLHQTEHSFNLKLIINVMSYNIVRINYVK